ncbi:Uncharacterized protein GBIM_08673 [Gryllus bimaculatus]|nr:Uncharacterized protein GBIM_08673 [Gryllus bimaculatus]
MGHGCCEWWRLITSAIGTIVGIAMFILFFIVWGNHAAGVWALFTGVFAAVCFHLTYLHFRDLLETWHNVETLQGMTLLGVLVSLAGAAGFAWYIFVAVYYQIR